MAILLSDPAPVNLIGNLKSWLTRLCLILALIIAVPAAAQAQYPQPTNSFVNDYAGILTAQDSAAIQSALQNLKSTAGVEMVLVTINSLKDYHTGDNSIESFATNLFNNWGVGGASSNNGVMILYDRGERQVRVELGRAYSRRDDEVMRQIIDQTMLPYFRNNQYSQGLYQGVNAVMNSVAPQAGGSNYGSAPAVPTTSTTYGPAAEQREKGGLSFGKIILMLLAAFVIYRIYRSRARRNSGGGGGFGGGSTKGRGATGSFGESKPKSGGFFGGGSSRNSGSSGSGSGSKGNFFPPRSGNPPSDSSESSGSSNKGGSGGGGGSGSW